MYRRTTARPQGSLTVIDYIERHPTEKQRLNVLTSYYDQQQANTVIEFDRMQLGVFSLNELQLLMENVEFSVSRYTKPADSSTECLTVLVGTKP